MARKLTVKQKNMVKKEWKRLKTNGVLFPAYDDLSYDFQQKLDDVHCFENLPTHVDVLLSDLEFENRMS